MEGEHSDGAREQRIRESGIEAITQATAVAKINRALKAKTSLDGRTLYKAGDLIDYHRPPATKDDHGGWNGPYPVVRNEPERGQVICKVGEREIAVQYPDARCTLFTEVLIAGLPHDGPSNGDAMHIVLRYIAELPAGTPAEAFGYAISGGSYHLTTMSKKAPRIHLALQYLIRNVFQVANVVTVRLGKSVKKTQSCNYCDGCTLVYYHRDVNPEFQMYECDGAALDIPKITGSGHSRIIQCLTLSDCEQSLNDFTDVPDGLPPLSNSGDRAEVADLTGGLPLGDQTPDAPAVPEMIDISGRLPTIHEDDAEGDDTISGEAFFEELTEAWKEEIRKITYYQTNSAIIQWKWSRMVLCYFPAKPRTTLTSTYPMRYLSLLHQT